MIRRILLSPFLLCFAFFVANAQKTESYAIYPGSQYAVADLDAALDLCQLDRYRKPESRVNLTFDDGSIVELFSARELKDLNVPYNPSEINQTDTELNNTFILHPKGYILEKVKKWSKEDIGKSWNKQE